MADAVKQYLKQIEKEYQTGHATEHSYRSYLKNLIESLGERILASNEPKKIKCGAPDYIVERNSVPIGYIEAKDVGVSLSDIEKSEQLERYRSSLSNLILTDYLEFRWYESGEHRLTVRLAEIINNRLTENRNGIKTFYALINSFLNPQVATLSSSYELARRMAALASFIQEIILNALNDDDKGGEIRETMEGFRRVLLHTLTEYEFADMYAQSICYGLFSARCNSDLSERFTRERAIFDFPKTNPFLRKMFSYLTGPDLDERILWVVDDLVGLLNHCDMASILDNFGNQTHQKDPVIYFYETFLTAYNPKIREMRGIYYTPEPVVSYIVRSVDQILKTQFGLTKGLADSSKVKIEVDKGNTVEFHKVQILDPACGTGTFLHEVIDHIHDEFKGNEGMWSGYVSEHLLPRLFGFELLMAPYAVAHMKIGLQLKQSGYDFGSAERVRIYLTNTLDEAYDSSDRLDFAGWVSQESNSARQVKTEIPIMVVIGNPPYSGHSANNTDWIYSLLRGGIIQSPADYFKVDKLPLGERNPKWLNDDYVKFIRFGQWQIDKNGSGILAFITNHGYLDNPTFRGMRQSLTNTFTDIYLLDLHGDKKKKEKSPDGSDDQNVFDIQQGVSIGIFVKRPKIEAPAVVYHSEIWGSREEKYNQLLNNDILSTDDWKELKPQSPYYLFVPQDLDLWTEYSQDWSVSDIFPLKSIGIVTARDKLTIHWNKQEVMDTVKHFVELEPEVARTKYRVRRDSQDWKLHLAQQDLRTSQLDERKVAPILYRPFDIRYTYYTGRSSGFICRPRLEVMSHMVSGRNVGLITTRQVRTDKFNHVFVGKDIKDFHILGTAHASANLFPLYLYPKLNNVKCSRSTIIQDAQRAISESGRLPAKDVPPERDRIEQLIKKLFPNEYYARFPNFNFDFIADVESRLCLSFIPDGIGNLKSTFGPEDIFYYIYAILHSHDYRHRYLEFLKRDFPRIPLTSNIKLFVSLCSFGKELVNLHFLLKDVISFTNYPVKGTDVVNVVSYDDNDQVWINNSQYFEGVPLKVWNFYIGAYQVCRKWLEERKNRKLTHDEIEHYRNIVASISETINTMDKIDSVISDCGGFPLQ